MVVHTAATIWVTKWRCNTHLIIFNLERLTSQRFTNRTSTSFCHIGVMSKFISDRHLVLDLHVHSLVFCSYQTHTFIFACVEYLHQSITFFSIPHHIYA